MTPEDEEFNRIEMESRIKQEYVRWWSMNRKRQIAEAQGANNRMVDAHQAHVIQLMDELAIARKCLRELGDRLATLEKPWDGLTRDEQSFVYSNLHNATSREDSFWVDFANAIEAKLKEKNNG